MSEQSVSANGSLEDRLAAVVDGFMAEAEAGGRPDVEDYARRHPEIASVLRQVLPALGLIGSAGGPAPGAASAAAPGDEIGGVLGDFRLLREVGRGGMGIVYEAEQLSLGRQVALKVLPFAATMDPRQLQRFHNEARAAASLEHPHIVPVYGIGCERGVHYYAMKFIEGHTLAELIAQLRQPAQAPAEPADATARLDTDPTERAPLGAAHWRRVAEWGIQAAEALEHAHTQGVVHRDVKPGNLMVDPQGKLWVTDFGLARSGPDGGLTMTGDLLGTLRYMSPEQALARHGLVDHRTDVYALGATLYELLTLQPAVRGADRQEVLQTIAFEEPKRLRSIDRSVPRDLETVVLKALEKDPADRYATAQELADDLRRWLEDRPIQARRPTHIQRAAKWGKRHLAAVVTAAVVLFIFATGLAVGVALIWKADVEKGVLLIEKDDALKQAKADRDKAAAATVEEAKQRRRADDNFRRSVEQFTELLKEVNKERSKSPGITRVRQAQANRVIKLLQAQLAANRPDPEGRLLTGLAYQALAQAHRALGKYPQAGDLLVQASVTLEQLAADFPEDARFQQSVSDVQDDLLSLVGWWSEDSEELMMAGKYAEAAQRARDALTFFQKNNLHVRVPELSLVKGIEAAYRLAHALRASGRSAEAEESCTLAMNYAAKLITEFSKNVFVPFFQLYQAGGCTLRGLCRADVGRTAEAEADLRQAIALLDAVEPKFRKVLVTHPTNQPMAHHALGNLLWAAGRREEAAEEYRRAEKGWRDEPRNRRSSSCLAWLLATCPDPKLRNPIEAVKLAKQAAADPPWPDTRPWQALGAAQYRAGDMKAALAALEKARQFNDGGDGIDFFFLAMACWKQGEKDRARRWYDRAVQWTEKSRPHDPELLRFRAEAAEMLNVEQKKD
jgi:serine/threonine protein kinase